MVAEKKEFFFKCIIGYSRKNPKGEIEDMEIPGVLKKKHVEILGVN